jgi:DNA gyrase subunit A
MENNEKIIIKGIEDEMRTAYIDYSMSVIVSRALPDVRDGLKPVHRRVLYGMSDLGLTSNRPHKKSARIVGEVLGKYHPHGDSAVYDTMVRLAQEWSLRYPLVDGQGNFGSIDGDSPAAMRYTEARLRKIAEEMLIDIEKNTVNFAPNFDDSLQEPTVLPSKIPNLLVNGTSGIAVGMATNMAPHNLKEVVQGICAYIDNRDITIDELMKFIKAPDFPTGGIIYGYDGVREAFLTGRGRIVVRALAQIETNKTGKEKIIISEIPYLVNKASLVSKIAELMKEGKLEGISEVRDESDREGLRVVVEIKKDGDANVVLNQLYKNTSLQTTFGVNNVALVKGRPMTLNLKDLIVYYVEHRHEVVVRRTQYDLDQALQRAHILEGLIIALDNLDAVIALIRAAATPEVARNGLMTNFNLSEIQAKAILDMRLQRLTGLEMDKIRAEYDEIMKKIAYFREVLANESLRMQIIKEELLEVAKDYGDERRTQIVYSAEDFSIEDMIANEDVVITITHEGYIKRTAINNYKRQGRGGVGAKGTTTKEEDFVEHLFIASTHNYLLFFTEKGKCYWLKAFEIPEGSKASKGRSIRNLIQIDNDDKVKAFINISNLEDKNFVENHFIVMVTKKGTIKKTAVEAYSRPRSTGIIAINIEEGDELIDAQLTDGTNEIVIATHNGMAIRFNEAHVRDMGRNATGVRGISLDDNDFVIGMVVVKHPDTQLLVVSEKGYGKRSKIDEYRITNRGGKGVKTINITPKTGHLIAIKLVLDTDDLMIITKENNMIRTSVSSIREAGRNTQGVILIRLKEGDDIAAVAKIAEKEDDTNHHESTETNDNSELFDE